MSNNKQKPAQPPKAPRVPRKLQFHLTQLIGVPLLMLIPLLALLGAFGESTRSVSASNSQMELRVEYPTRFRYKMVDALNIALTNRSNETLPRVIVSIDQGYIDAFSTVSFSPGIKEITEGSYQVELSDLQPGETRRIAVSLRAQQYWRHQGYVAASLENAEGLRVPINTITFP